MLHSFAPLFIVRHGNAKRDRRRARVAPSSGFMILKFGAGINSRSPGEKRPHRRLVAHLVVIVPAAADRDNVVARPCNEIDNGRANENYNSRDRLNYVNNYAGEVDGDGGVGIIECARARAR